MPNNDDARGLVMKGDKLNPKVFCPYCDKEFIRGTGHPELLDSGTIELCKESCFKMYLNILAVPRLTAVRNADERKMILSKEGS